MNEQLRKRWFPDGSMYVYYTPTHWMPATPPPAIDPMRSYDPMGQHGQPYPCPVHASGRHDFNESGFCGCNAYQGKKEPTDE